MAHNNKLKLDTTMLQTNTAMHLMAFMLTQRDLVLDLLSIIKEHEDIDGKRYYYTDDKGNSTGVILDFNL